jgi:hypothetical protein
MLFSGYGSQVLGRVVVATLSEVRWTSAAGRFELFAGGAPVIAGTALSGTSAAGPGTYDRVRVVAPGSWTVRIAPISRRPAAAVLTPGRVSPSVPRPGGGVRPMFFSGRASRSLGTVTLSGLATLRWTHGGGGPFHLVYGGSSTAVESLAGSGSLEVPPATYRDVYVQTTGRWTIRIG